MKIKWALALAALATVAAVALANAGFYQELEKGKDLWYLVIDKDSKNIGYIHETHQATTAEGKAAIKSVRTFVDTVANSTIAIEWIRMGGDPAERVWVTNNGVKTTGKPIGGGWLFERGGQKVTIEKGHFDHFSYDDPGIFTDAGHAQVGTSKKLRLFDVVTLERIERTYKNNGEKETTFLGQKVKAHEFEISGGPNVVKVHVAEDILGVLDARVEGVGTSTKLVKKAEVLAAFPNAQ